MSILIFPISNKYHALSMSKKAALKRINKKMSAIESKHPNFNFKDQELFSDWVKWRELMNENIRLSVDLDFCANIDRKKMCSDCNCWKLLVVNIK